MKAATLIQEPLFPSLLVGKDLSSTTADSPTHPETFKNYWRELDQDKEKEWEIIYYDSGSSLPPLKRITFEPISDIGRDSYLGTDIYTWFSKLHGVTKIEYLGNRNMLKGENEYQFLQIPDVKSNATVISGSDISVSVGSCDYPEDSNIIQELVMSSIHESYEVGMDNYLTLNLEAAIYKWGKEFLKELYASNSKFSVESLQAIIETIGRIEHGATRSYRIWLLKLYLSHSKALIRDVASMALVNLAGQYSEPFIKDAIAQETNTSLKADMELLLEDLAEV